MQCRPHLSKDLSPEVFEQYYYTVKEMRAFCKQEKLLLSSGDRKNQIKARIQHYLETGEKAYFAHPSSSTQVDEENKGVRENFSPEQRIGRGFTFGRAMRNYFEREDVCGPKFRTSVPWMAWVEPVSNFWTVFG